MIKKNIFATYEGLDPVILSPPADLEENLFLDDFLSDSFFLSNVRTSKKDKGNENNGVKPLTLKYRHKSEDIDYSLFEGFDAFNRAYDAVEARNPEAKKYRAFLTDLASAESGFRSGVQNGYGEPAYGYFLFWEEPGKVTNITNFAHTDIESFRRNPELQIESAIRFADDILGQLTNEDKKRAELKGLNKWALLAGAWLAGVNGLRRYLYDLGDPDDTKGGTRKGTSVSRRTKLFNKDYDSLKNGGTIKYQDGGIFLFIKEVGNNLYNLFFNSSSDKPVTTVRKENEPIIKTPTSMKTLPYAQSFRFIRHLENPRDKGIHKGLAKPYDSRTAGYGTDFKSGHPELASKIRSGKWTALEAKDLAVTDMRRHDRVIQLAFRDLDLTDRPDTISLVPRLLMALARYHYGNIEKSMPEWGKAVVNGDADKIKLFALDLAKGYNDRYDKIKDIEVYGDNPLIKNFDTK